MSPAPFARLAGLLLISAGVALLQVLHAQDPAKPDKPASGDKPAGPEKPESKPADAPSVGDQLVRQALEKLNKLGWISTDIRQELSVRGLRVAARGRYVFATGDRVAYQLETAVAGVTGSNRIVCDGRKVWRITQLGNQKSIQRYDQSPLRDFKPAEEGDELEKEVERRFHDDLLAMHGFSGVRAVLEDLRDRVLFALPEPTVLSLENGKQVNVHLLRGEWTAKTLEKLIPKGNSADATKKIVEAWENRQGFVNVPRKCRLYLGKAGATDLWPYRLEWLGPDRPGGEEELLAAIELSDPQLADAPPADADQFFEVKLTPEEVKQIQTVPFSEFIKSSRDSLVTMKREQERAKEGARTLDPTKLDSPMKPRELVPPGKALPGRP